MKFLEAAESLKQGRSITNGSYILLLESNFLPNMEGYTLSLVAYTKTGNLIHLDKNKLELDSLKDNWEIIREE